MRRRWLLALVPALAVASLVGGDADVQAAKSKKADFCAQATVWTTSGTTLPLALVHGRAITRPRGECESSYWEQGTRFTAVDSAGRPVGGATWGDDQKGTWLRKTRGRDGVGLFALGERWTGPEKSAAFEPNDETRRGFDALYMRIAKHHPTAVTFFHAKAGSDGTPTVYAAASGRALVVAYLDEKSRWQRAYVETWKAPKTKEPFHVRSVLDMNGDGRPEIVAFLREADLEGYDVVLAGARGGRRYRAVTDNMDDGP